MKIIAKNFNMESFSKLENSLYRVGKRMKPYLKHFVPQNEIIKCLHFVTCVVEMKTVSNYDRTTTSYLHFLKTAVNLSCSVICFFTLVQFALNVFCQVKKSFRREQHFFFCQAVGIQYFLCLLSALNIGNYFTNMDSLIVVCTLFGLTISIFDYFCYGKWKLIRKLFPFSKNFGDVETGQVASDTESEIFFENDNDFDITLDDESENFTDVENEFDKTNINEFSDAVIKSSSNETTSQCMSTIDDETALNFSKLKDKKSKDFPKTTEILYNDEDICYNTKGKQMINQILKHLEINGNKIKTSEKFATRTDIYNGIDNPIPLTNDTLDDGTFRSSTSICNNQSVSTTMIDDNSNGTLTISDSNIKNHDNIEIQIEKCPESQQYPRQISS